MPRSAKIITITLVIIISSFCMIMMFRMKKRRMTPLATLQSKPTMDISTLESFQYDFSIVKAATNDFSEENKLGWGEFGAVYKAVADSFINYDNADNAYHVSMSPMVNVDFNEDPEIIKLRRSEKLVKPAAALLSPYVAYKRFKDKQAKKLRNEDRQIAFIKQRYPYSGNKHLSLIVGNCVGPNFWESLLGEDGRGWLSDDK
ncbi:cysteine-rich receptor-like protein kinase 7 isoform X3 [Helianthus annuus]|uniref:cysteine-rich receptor-like protein kinase 7 isoform X3 n=1 Tax=Helianthus annuus TaxID=4232 RepID=UPI0016532862|nr:cysteine-rich receptor-like protein kinase 7 isoform X3 [Helianthus annuus]